MKDMVLSGEHLPPRGELPRRVLKNFHLFKCKLESRSNLKREFPSEGCRECSRSGNEAEAQKAGRYHQFVFSLCRRRRRVSQTFVSQSVGRRVLPNLVLLEKLRRAKLD